MASSWSDAEAIAAGLYAAPGSAEAAAIRAEGQALSGRSAISDVFPSGTGSATATTSTGLAAPQVSPATGSSGLDLLSTGLQDNGAARVTMGTSGFKLPSLDDVIKGVTGGATEAVTGSGAAPGSWQATLSEYFLRAIIIILGFIFVAAGLAMFRGNSPIELVKKIPGV